MATTVSVVTNDSLSQKTAEKHADPTTLFIKFRRKMSPIFTTKFLKILICGQILSLLICGTAVTSQLLYEKHGVQHRQHRVLLTIYFLGLVYGIHLFFISGRDGFKEMFKARWWKYLFVAAVDVEANYLVVKAYQYTNLTSIQLLDCITIPVVILLSYTVLRVRYRIYHFAGVGICLLGVGALVGADVYAGRSHSGGSDKFLGDILCLIGASLYGVSNVAEEFAIRNFSRVEFLGMIGLWASLISGIQLVILERHELTNISWNTEVVLLFLAFAVCLFLLYSVFPLVIQISSAAVVNLSILTADFYSLMFGLFLFHYMFSALYIFAFMTIIIGLVVWGLKPTGEVPRNSNYARMDAENAGSIQRLTPQDEPSIHNAASVEQSASIETDALNSDDQK
uniref:LOW QUALITY PROTEIN: solute carrier family 35 member F2-like n=1 Tax=Saccoglossus kowalevskii TaxID=10224 RepID=A0ABM0M2C9_SACKO|nr:PREDICTED: LOW QUALITY PROTEIN: solute carrier family 35 member F2-like [Saccoglossus kowalevskii]